MARYVYKAKKGISETVEGFIEAENQEEALNKLIAKELFPINITEESSTEQPLSRKSPKNKQIRKKINSREILTFVQKLTTLVRAKVELLSSIRILYEQTENILFKDIIYEIYSDIKEGKTFSDSLSRHSRIFPTLFINIIKSGEASGRLDFALEQINEYMYREENLRNKISIALAYPILLLSVGIISIFVLINFVVPKLRPIFEGMGEDLPAITKFVLKLSDLSNKNWLWIIGALILAGIIIYYQKGSVLVNNLKRKIKMNLPIVKRLLRNQELAHFSRSLSLLLNSGVSALKSIEVASLTVEDPVLKRQLNKVYQEVSSGQSLSKTMSGYTNLPDFFIKMIAVGEESGRLGEILDEISRSYTQQLETDIMLISSLLEPVLILGLGAVLGLIILSILLPTFQITQFVK
ncbi:MAG: type II secretion system F family protein [Candidatus Omnitrophota bacterium]